MSDRLPVRVDPYRLAEQGQTLAGKLKVSKMPRLSALLAGPGGEVECRLSFVKQGRLHIVSGHVTGCLLLTCQRCLETFEQAVDSDFSLVLVTGDEEAVRLPDAAETLLVVDDELVISTVVEDEILLAMPAIPRHAHEQGCLLPEAEGKREGCSDAHQENPFAVLEQLKKH